MENLYKKVIGLSSLLKATYVSGVDFQKEIKFLLSAQVT